MHVFEESDSGTVPMNHSNKSGKPPAESEEGRPLIKENTHQLSTHSTQSGVRVSQGLAGVRRAARCNAPRYSPPSRQIILRLVSQLHSRLLSWDRIAACIGASEYPTGRLEPFPVALIVSERSSPSRVRCAAPQPGARP